MKEQGVEDEQSVSERQPGKDKDGSHQSTTYSNLIEGIKMNCLNIEREFVLAKALLSGLKTTDYRRSVIQIT